MTETEQTTELIRDLVSRFVEKPEALRIAKQEAEDGACYWLLSGDPDDGGRLAGKHGVHVAALALLVYAFGIAVRRRFVLAVDNGQRPEFRAKLEPRMAKEYDAEPTLELLVRILGETALGEFDVEVSPANKVGDVLHFTFTIKVRDIRDYMALTSPINPHSSLTLKAALSALLWAIGRKDGLTMWVEVKNDER